MNCQRWFVTLLPPPPPPRLNQVALHCGELFKERRRKSGKRHTQWSSREGVTASPRWYTNTGRRARPKDPGADRGQGGWCSFDHAAHTPAVLRVRLPEVASVTVHRQSVCDRCRSWSRQCWTQWRCRRCSLSTCRRHSCCGAEGCCPYIPAFLAVEAVAALVVDSAVDALALCSLLLSAVSWLVWIRRTVMRWRRWMTLLFMQRQRSSCPRLDSFFHRQGVHDLRRPVLAECCGIFRTPSGWTWVPIFFSPRWPTVVSSRGLGVAGTPEVWLPGVLSPWSVALWHMEEHVS